MVYLTSTTTCDFNMLMFHSRVDLRPTASPTDELESGQELSPSPYLTEHPEAINGEEPWLATDPTAGSPEISAVTRRSNGLSLYVNHTLNLRRMRNATPEERLDALRRIRTVNRANDAITEGGERARTRVGSRLSRLLGAPQSIPSDTAGTEAASAAAAPTSGMLRYRPLP